MLLMFLPYILKKNHNSNHPNTVKALFIYADSQDSHNHQHISQYSNPSVAPEDNSWMTAACSHKYRAVDKNWMSSLDQSP